MDYHKPYTSQASVLDQDIKKPNTLKRTAVCRLVNHSSTASTHLCDIHQGVFYLLEIRFTFLLVKFKNSLLNFGATDSSSIRKSFNEACTSNWNVFTVQLLFKRLIRKCFFVLLYVLDICKMAHFSKTLAISPNEGSPFNFWNHSFKQVGRISRLNSKEWVNLTFTNFC